MNRNSFEIDKASIWSDVERKIGEKVPDEGRRRIEAILELTNQDTYIEDLRADLHIHSQIHLVLKGASRLKTNFNSQNQSTVSPPKRRYKRSFQKRLQLVSLIMDRWVTQVNTEHKAADISYEPLASFKYPIPRMDWKEICSQWNKDHPYDQKDPTTLRVEFYRAWSEKDLQQELFTRIEKEIRDRLDLQTQILEKSVLDIVQLNTRLIRVLLIIKHKKELSQEGECSSP
jgi:hypothetical protein